jgi:hypothetical protein
MPEGIELPCPFCPFVKVRNALNRGFTTEFKAVCGDDSSNNGFQRGYNFTDTKFPIKNPRFKLMLTTAMKNLGLKIMLDNIQNEDENHRFTSGHIHLDKCGQEGLQQDLMVEVKEFETRKEGTITTSRYTFLVRVF